MGVLCTYAYREPSWLASHHRRSSSCVACSSSGTPSLPCSTVPLCALLSPLFSQGRSRTSALYVGSQRSNLNHHPPIWFSTHPNPATTTTVDEMVTVTPRRAFPRPTTYDPHRPWTSSLPTIRTLPCGGAESIPRASRRASHWQRALLHASPGT